MRRSPYLIARELQDILRSYLETAYRISNPAVFDERSKLLQERGVVFQTPFIETTPRFKAGAWLKELNLRWIPKQLPEFASIGLPVGRYPLYLHQEKALTEAWAIDGAPRNLIVASGTGSGKTEIFYLTILAEILREALSWSLPTSNSTDMGRWARNDWHHRRRNETRPAAMRAMVLYPMNALVNDQLRRLRKMLTTDEAIRWQRQHLNNNLIYFGRYTSQTRLPGSPSNRYKRNEWQGYITDAARQWDFLDEEFRALGNWPRPNGPEMLSRWNIQAAPPDILLTNYSMLEYMLLRPIEANVFETTREWLAQSPDHRFTLVLDEAHTYSGTRGTEVAYLLRRLFERLGAGPNQVRCIATSASLGDSTDELSRVRDFAADLFGHPREQFHIIQAETEQTYIGSSPPTLEEMETFARFQKALESIHDIQDEKIAVQNLVSRLGLSIEGENYIQQLFSALKNHPRLNDLRRHTARNAMALNLVADRIWDSLGDPTKREAGTAGLLAAGALARKDGQAQSDLPPALPSRIHLMYRGLPGLWACLDPNCSEVNEPSNRPCGKLYAEPRIWCNCGARVIELLSCRTCGLLIGGGIEESGSGPRRVWPYEADLEGGVGQYEKYTLFALEDPTSDTIATHEWAEVYRNVRTTAVSDSDDRSARLTWEPPLDDTRAMIKARCPRCGQRPHRRNALEPLRTTGTQAFGTLLEHAFRLQSPTLRTGQIDPSDSSTTISQATTAWWVAQTATRQAVRPPKANPNAGRKALAFSDSRQNAARLAGDLVYLHYRDLFRQLLLLGLSTAGQSDFIKVPDLLDKVFDLAIEGGIDPTFGEVENFWARYGLERTNLKREAKRYMETYLRREIADRQVGVEALGLAKWSAWAIEEASAQVPSLPPFNQTQTVALLHATVRILASQNVILPHSLDPDDWPDELVERYFRKIILLEPNRLENPFVWHEDRNNRLTRYLKAVLEAGNLGETVLGPLMTKMWNDYLRPTQVAIPTEGRRRGFGVPLSAFGLSTMPEQLFRCRACGYVSAETVFNVCLRCHQQCDSIVVAESNLRQNRYYRRLSDYSHIDEMPDPFPLRVLEHTAQISVEAATDRERYFQDQFFTEEAGEFAENPLQKSVDILSVTTTMEMGIDIGDLTVVGLHNTPPTVANYQQRSGRAGRRSDGVAEVITFARHRSHDQYYFDRVAEIVTGSVRIPAIHLKNPVILRRHINALILQRFFGSLRFGDDKTQLFEAFGTVSGLLDSDGLRLEMLRNFIERVGNTSEISVAIRRASLGSEISLESILRQLRALPDQIQDLAQAANPETLVLNLLIEKGELPRYAFPVDVVALWTERPSRWNQGEEVQRGLDIALSEYAPGAEVIIDGYIYQSDGLYEPFEDNPSYQPSGWYYECPVCRHVHFASSENRTTPPSWVQCEMCREPVAGQNSRYQIMPAIKPLGFRTDWKRESRKKYRGGGRERAGYASTAQLAAGESANHGELRFDGRLYVHNRSGDLYMINRGPQDDEEPGFLICPHCGKHIGTPNERHYDPVLNKRCRAERGTRRSVLLHAFNSDVALLGVCLPSGLNASPTHPRGKAAWLSLGTALRQGAAAYLQIDPDELAMGVRPWHDPNFRRLLAEVFFYDTLPNGAGYAVEVIRHLEPIFTTALNISSGCSASCEAACYHCLLEYGNQRIHQYLDRHLATDLIRFILGGNEPELEERQAQFALSHLGEMARDNAFEIQPLEDDVTLATVQSPDTRRRVAIVPVHTLAEGSQILNIVRSKGWHPVIVAHFELARRPFWVWDRLQPILSGQSDATSID